MKRHLPVYFCALATALALAPPTHAADDGECRFDAPRAADADTVHDVHAITIHGEPLYAEGFTHLESVNPDAPKGGTLRLAAIGTFDSFNPYIPKGRAGPGGGGESLTEQVSDDPGAEYGLIAERIEYPEDRSWVTFHLRDEARWHDGRPITADDAVWSFETLKEHGTPAFRYYYGNVSKAEKLGRLSVKFHFSERNNVELPVIIGQLPILPRHWWETRDFTKTTLEPPLGSGPYRVADFEAGRYVVLERVPDWWGKDLPINVGRNNFGRIRYDYYRDDTIVRQALKGGRVDYRDENNSKAWASEYDVPAVRRGWLNKELIEHSRPTGMQAFVFNLRRHKFSDARVREAIGLAFDFEWSNERLFYGQYHRNVSFFGNSELASTGLPEGKELEILDCFREQLPESVFTETFAPPATTGDGFPRDNLKRAFALLADAGYEVRDFEMVNTATGEPLRFEVLLVAPAFERIVLPFARNLEKLGIETSVRLVDSSQYQNRLRAFDFDMIISGWGQSNSPGNEQRNYWTSKAADSPAARNYSGLKNEAIDALVELLIEAPTREELVIRTRALDRALLAQHFIVPAWHSREDRVLYWDKFSRPQKTPLYGTSWDRWWYDEAKAAKLAAERDS